MATRETRSEARGTDQLGPIVAGEVGGLEVDGHVREGGGEPGCESAEAIAHGDGERGVAARRREVQLAVVVEVADEEPGGAGVLGVPADEGDDLAHRARARVRRAIAVVQAGLARLAGAAGAAAVDVGLVAVLDAVVARLAAVQTLSTQTLARRSRSPRRSRPSGRRTSGTPPPPQSTSVSVPFLTPSAAGGRGRHTLLVHSAVGQSRASDAALAGGARRTQPPPPQSTSVSAPFLHLVGARGRGADRRSCRRRSWQSPPPAQALAGLRTSAQVPPPQSTSVSAPFRTPSLQVADARRTGRWRSSPLTQSAAAAQPWPAPHCGHSAAAAVDVGLAAVLHAVAARGGGGAAGG